jgi:hypothetical protein
MPVDQDDGQAIAAAWQTLPESVKAAIRKAAGMAAGGEAGAL